MAQLFYTPRFTALDGNGDPLAGAKLNFYKTGTSTRKDTYTDEGRTTAHANPVIADADGEFPAIYLDGTYKVVLTDADDVEQWTEDPFRENAVPSDIDNLKELVDATALQVDGLQVQMRAFYSDTDTGGGHFYWDADRAKSDANGVTIIDPDNIGTLSDTALGTFHSQQGTGSGTGCWVRLNDTPVFWEWGGARAGEGSTTAMQAVLDAYSSTGATIQWDATFRVTRTSGEDYCLLVPASGIWVIQGSGTLDIRATEASSGRGVCGIAWRGGNKEGLVINDIIFDGSNSGTNADGIWCNPKSSDFMVSRAKTSALNGSSSLRHFIVETDYDGTSSEASEGLFHVSDCQTVSCSDVGIIISQAASPRITGGKVKDNGDWGVEIGQKGDRSFAGNSLSGTASNYVIRGLLVEGNDGGILVVDARGGSVQADFEANDGALASRSDAGTAIRANLDFTGTGTSGGGDFSGGYFFGCTFAGPGTGQLNVKTRAQTYGGPSLHQDGNPCFSHIDDEKPAICVGQSIQGGSETIVGQITELVDTDNTGDFTAGETVTGGTSSATGRVIEWDSANNKLTVTWLSGLFSTGEVVTGGMSGATLNNLDSITRKGQAGVILAPDWQTITIREVTTADGNTGLKAVPSFDLDHRAFITFAAGLEDATGTKSANYQWILKNVTDGTSAGNIFLTASGYSREAFASFQRLRDVAVFGQQADGKDYSPWFRNKSGSSQDLTGFLTYTLADVNLSG